MVQKNSTDLASTISPVADVDLSSHDIVCICGSLWQKAKCCISELPLRVGSYTLHRSVDT